MRSLILTLPIFLAGLASAQTTPSPALLVLNKTDETLAIVDPASNRVVATARTGFQPHEVAVSEDGRTAYVTNYGSADRPGSTLSVIDLATRQETKVDLGDLRRPHGIWVAGGKVYFTAEDSKAIARYDPATKKVDWRQPSNQERTHMVLLNKTGDTAFSSNMGSNSVNIYSRGADDRWTTTTVAVGPGPEAIDLSPDQKEIWTAHTGDGGVTIIDVASKKVTATLPRVNQRPNRLKFTPDGKQVLLSDSGNGDLVIVDAATRKETKRLKLGQTAVGIQMAPDGTRAYVALQSDNAVAVIDLKALSVTGRISPGQSPDGLAWAVRR